MEAAMSDATLQAVHDAIAAHIADLNAGAAEYLTEWVAVGTTAIANNPRGSMYYYLDNRIPRHHGIGLLDHGMNVLNDPGCDCDDGDD